VGWWALGSTPKRFTGLSCCTWWWWLRDSIQNVWEWLHMWLGIIVLRFLMWIGSDQTTYVVLKTNPYFVVCSSLEFEIILLLELVQIVCPYMYLERMCKQQMYWIDFFKEIQHYLNNVCIIATLVFWLHMLRLGGVLPKAQNGDKQF
jgi:hypothetical protein